MTYAVTVYCYLGPKLGLVVRKHLALIGIENSEARWNSSSKTISEVKGYSGWKYNEFLPLVTLTLSGPVEAFQWLLSQLLRYYFCGICGSDLEGLALSISPYWPALCHLFFYCLYWCGNAWKEHLSFMFVPVSLWSRIYSGSCTGTQVTNVSPRSFSLGGIPEAYSDCTQVASEASKVLMVRNWTSVWDAIRSTPGAPPPHLGGRTGRDKYSACISKGQTKSNHGRKALV